MICEISQPQKDKYNVVFMIPLPCGIQKGQTHRTENRMVIVGAWEEEWGRH
jgi:hypothetical protein